MWKDKIQNRFTEASSITDKASGYAQDAKNVRAGNVDDVEHIHKEIIEKVEIDEVTALQENDQILQGHKPWWRR